jgi:hypothetical protein
MFPAPEPPDPHWRKSSRSAAAGNCVEVARTPDAVAVRDSKNPTGALLRFDLASWREFVRSVSDGMFDDPR